MLLALIAIWALAEAIVFFIVADVPIMALGIKAGARKALIGAVIAAVFAAIGGGVLYIWASENPVETVELMSSIPAISEELVLRVWDDWRDNGALGMMVGSFSGVPYKLYAATAGAQVLSGELADSLVLFFFASILARLPRFALIALISGWAGPKLVKRFGTLRVWIAFALCWAGFYAWYWSAMGW